MKSPSAILETCFRGLTVLALISLGSRAMAVEINGTVREASGDTATIVTKSDLVPKVGDKVDIFFKIPWVDDEISVATGRVTNIGESRERNRPNRKGSAGADHLFFERLLGAPTRFL